MKLLCSALFTVFLALGTTAYAQDQPQTAPPANAKTSITGCLTKGASDGTYVITDQTSGDKVPFTGPAQLDQYVNQTVKLTGTISKEGSDKSFRPESISQVAPSCGKGQ